LGCLFPRSFMRSSTNAILSESAGGFETFSHVLSEGIGGYPQQADPTDPTDPTDQVDFAPHPLTTGERKKMMHYSPRGGGCGKIKAMMIRITLDDLYRPVAECLTEVRGEIGRIWEEALRLVRVDAGPMPKAGGKLLRPALCLLSAGAIGGTDLKQYVRLAAAFEALHIASLAHDDVIDRALLRRGNTSLNALWDNHAAVLGGDYLVARAVNLLAGYNSCAVIDNAITSVRRMAEGELYFFGREVSSVTQQECIQLAEQKTASLFAEACCAPTFVIDPQHHDALHQFGMSLGVAFQIIDDLLDLTQPETSLGKPACGDVAEGKFTLPILFMREALAPDELQRLEAMRGTELSPEDRAWVSAKVESTGSRNKTMDAARAFMDRALGALFTLPRSDYRDSMEGLAEFILVRHS